VTLMDVTLRLVWPHWQGAGTSVADVDAVTDVVGLTIAEFIPRQVIHLQQLLTGFPLFPPA